MGQIMKLDKTYIANTYSRFPIEIVSGKGSIVTDSEGKQYIDLGTGIGVNTFGFADEAWQKAVISQMQKYQHTSNLYYTEPSAVLAEMLCLRTGMRKVFFSNSGAEANECAIKAARKYACEKKGPEYYNIITLRNSFHGRTITTLAATGQDSFHKDFQPLTQGFLHAEHNNIESIKQLVERNKVAAILFEVVLGEGGVIPLEPEFVKGMAKIAADYDILLIADEVQVGNGRTGELYGYMHYGIMPDIVTTAKGLGGGLPIGATLFSAKTADVFTPGTHGSTFGGNPLSCAAAISVLSRIDTKLLKEVKEKSDHIFATLVGAKGIKSVNGLGLIIGIETAKDSKAVIQECIKRGVLPLSAKDKVRLLPALNIPQKELDQAIEIIKDVCGED
ncbi:MAG: aspartate aminotransferase family protein [Eubacteriales bacterium]|jgi:acetylornithine/N-succinyldiaminopimelate aminotransferase